MSATILTIREAVQTLLQTVDGLNAFDAEEASFPFPAALATVPDLDYYRGSAGATGTYEFDLPVLLFVAAGITVEASRLLAEYLDTTGARSIFAAISADNTLGGIVDNAVPMTAKVTGIEDAVGVKAWGAEIIIHIIARRS